MLQISTIFISFLLAIADPRGHSRISPLPSNAFLTIFRSFFNSIFGAFLFLIIVVLFIILLQRLFWIGLLHMARHGCQQILFILPLLFLLRCIWVRLLLLNHADLLLPYSIRSLLQLGVNFFQVLPVAGKPTAARVDWKYPFELIGRKILIYQVVIEAHSLAMLLDCHSTDISILHRQSLLTFYNNIQLPSLLNAQLQNL